MTVLAATALLATPAAYAHGRVVERTTGPSASWSNPVNRNLLALARCETGGINGGRPLWTHHNGVYAGALGFRHETWRIYKRHVRPVPRARYASSASPAEQLAVGRVLVRTFHGYSSWPSCSIRLGLR